MAHALGTHGPGCALASYAHGLGFEEKMSTLYAVVLRSELLLLLLASAPVFLGVGIRLVAGNVCRALFEQRGAEPPAGA